MIPRTENDVKNHFYAFLRRGIRRLNKFIGYKQNARVIRAIKPSVLVVAYDEERQKEQNP